MKKIIVLLISAVVSLSAFAQTGSVVGNITDKTTNEGLIGAVVEIMRIKGTDTLSVKQMTSGYNGTFTSSGLAYGNYLLRVQYLGYNSPELAFEINKSRTELGTIGLEQGIQMQAVVKQVEAIRTTQSGDTVIYNADSYKVAQDATVDGLLKKMPGVKVENGAVTAQGETVKKVYVDGKEYYGEDVSTAISSLPAEAVKSIEVFDKLSDNAEFTKMDDGEGYKALNIVTKTNVRKGQMGQLYAGYGYGLGEQNKGQNYVIGGGYVNFFNNDAKISVRALVNNLNQQKFSMNDILNTSGNAAGGDGPGAFMTAPESGIAHVALFGINYNDTWGKQDNVEFSSNYNFNITNTSNTRITERDYFSDSTTQNLYSSLYKQANSLTRNYNHNLSANVKVKFGETAQLRIRPSLSYQNNAPSSNSRSEYTPSIDSLLTEILQSNSKSTSYGWRAGLNMNYRQKIGEKAGRAISFNFNGSYNSSSGKGNSLSQTQIVPDSITQSDAAYGNYFKRQRWNRTSYGYNIGAGVTYAEPLGLYTLLSFNYNISYRYSDADKHTYLGTYDPADSTWTSFAFSSDYSNAQNSGYLINKVGPGVNFSKDGTTLTGAIYYQNAILTGDRTYPTNTDFGSKAFNNVTYSAMAKIKINKTNNIRMRLYSSTNNPSITDLQDVVDISNVQSISRGNSDLKPTYNHMFFAHYVRSNIEKGRTLMVGGGFTVTQDYIANRTIRNSPGYVITDPVTGAQLTTLTGTGSYSMPVNMNGYWKVNGMINFGMPLSFMKCNLNLMAGVNYAQTPNQLGVWDRTTNLVEWTKNISKKISPNASVVLGSNINENIDFTIMYSAQYNNVQNTYNVAKNNEYFQHTASASMKFVLPLSFTIGTEIGYSQYLGLTGNKYDRSFTVWNASIGKKVCRNNLGEITLFVNDILDQNRSFSRNWTALYLENVTNTSIGRYIGIQFSYNLRHFGKKGSRDSSLYESKRDGDMPPMPKEQGTGMTRSSGRGFGGPGGGGPGPM